jgi:hypothetical protein
LAESRKRPSRADRFVVCVRNDDYVASLERHKIYAVVPDADAERDGDLRVVDESGEDYLFSADRFVPITLPAAVRASLSESVVAVPATQRSRVRRAARNKGRAAV